MKDVKVREIMSEGVHQVSPKLSLVDLESDLAGQRISGAPVVERGRVVGIVSRSDIERALSQERAKSAAGATFYQQTDVADAAGSGAAADPTGRALESLRTLTVRDVMTRQVISLRPDASVLEAARVMTGQRIHRVLVVEDGGLRGIVSSLDIVRLVAERG